MPPFRTSVLQSREHVSLGKWQTLYNVRYRKSSFTFYGALRMRLIGIVGASGAGKRTVVMALRDRGFTHIEADDDRSAFFPQNSKPGAIPEPWPMVMTGLTSLADVEFVRNKGGELWLVRRRAVERGMDWFSSFLRMCGFAAPLTMDDLLWPSLVGHADVVIENEATLDDLNQAVADALRDWYKRHVIAEPEPVATTSMLLDDPAAPTMPEVLPVPPMEERPPLFLIEDRGNQVAVPPPVEFAPVLPSEAVQPPSIEVEAPVSPVNLSPISVPEMQPEPPRTFQDAESPDPAAADAKARQTFDFSSALHSAPTAGSIESEEDTEALRNVIHEEVLNTAPVERALSSSVPLLGDTPGETEALAELIPATIQVEPYKELVPMVAEISEPEAEAPATPRRRKPVVSPPVLPAVTEKPARRRHKTSDAPSDPAPAEKPTGTPRRKPKAAAADATGSKPRRRKAVEAVAKEARQIATQVGKAATQVKAAAKRVSKVASDARAAEKPARKGRRDA